MKKSLFFSLIILFSSLKGSDTSIQEFLFSDKKISFDDFMMDSKPFATKVGVRYKRSLYERKSTMTQGKVEKSYKFITYKPITRDELIEKKKKFILQTLHEAAQHFKYKYNKLKDINAEDTLEFVDETLAEAAQYFKELNNVSSTRF